MSVSSSSSSLGALVVVVLAVVVVVRPFAITSASVPLAHPSDQAVHQLVNFTLQAHSFDGVFGFLLAEAQDVDVRTRALVVVLLELREPVVRS